MNEITTLLRSRGVFQVVLTNRCNYNCNYCYQERNFKKFPNEFDSAEQLDRVCGKLVEHRKDDTHFEFQFLGGEPLLKKNVLMNFMRDYAWKYPKVVFNVITNGKLLDHETAVEYITSHPLAKIYFSCDGIDLNTNTHPKTWERIAILYDRLYQRFPERIGIIPVLTSSTIPNYVALLDLMAEKYPLSHVHALAAISDHFDTNFEWSPEHIRSVGEQIRPFFLKHPGWTIDYYMWDYPLDSFLDSADDPAVMPNGDIHLMPSYFMGEAADLSNKPDFNVITGEVYPYLAQKQIKERLIQAAKTANSRCQTCPISGHCLPMKFFTLVHLPDEQITAETVVDAECNTMLDFFWNMPVFAHFPTGIFQNLQQQVQLFQKYRTRYVRALYVLDRLAIPVLQLLNDDFVENIEKLGVGKYFYLDMYGVSRHTEEVRSAYNTPLRDIFCHFKHHPKRRPLHPALVCKVVRELLDKPTDHLFELIIPNLYHKVYYGPTWHWSFDDTYRW